MCYYTAIWISFIQFRDFFSVSGFFFNNSSSRSHSPFVVFVYARHSRTFSLFFDTLATATFTPKNSHQLMDRKFNKLQSIVIFVCIFLPHDRPLIFVGPKQNNTLFWAYAHRRTYHDSE